MIKLLLISCLFFMVSCQSHSPEIATKEVEKIPPPTAEKPFQEISGAQLLKAFKETGIPIIDEIQYTEENDPNNLLGRPNQYIDKINFSDKRSKIKNAVKQSNTIEVFKTQEDLETRKKYTEAISKSGSMFLQYIYAHKNILLRLDHKLLPKEAEEYEKVLKTL